MRKRVQLTDGEKNSGDSGGSRGVGSDLVDLSRACGHVTAGMVRRIRRPKVACVDCLKIGGQWVHLRVCLSCAHVACCDSSPNRHATAHYHATGHPIITSGEAGEAWAYCYPDDRLLSAE